MALRWLSPLAPLAAAIGVATAAPPVLEVPVDCPFGDVCFIQNYVDHDPGPGRVDHACGRLSYDGHNGTDFRVRDYVDMQRGYAVVAAAPGTVRAVRDGMADVHLDQIDRAAIAGREAGNAVAIVHDGGWETRYAHLMRGSVRVVPGARVTTGEVLGLIGLSGLTQFPHLDFGVVLDGVFVDPFAGAAFTGDCAAPKAPLWSEAARATLAYRPTGLLVAGFADAAPEARAAREGAFRLGAQASSPPALVFWVDLFGVLAGDVQRFQLIAPDRTTALDERATLEASQVSWFAFAGRRRPELGWQPGDWRGRYQLVREGRPIVDIERVIRLER